MRRIVSGIILSTTLAATGCATSGHRDSVGSLTGRSASWSARTSAPTQTRESLPPEQPDLFLPSASSAEHRGLAHYFPTLGRNTSPRQTASVRVATTPTTARPAPAPLEVVAHANTGRPSLFSGSRTTRVPQTYLTDVRSTRAKTSVQPAFLPVALQLPGLRQADQAVTPTSADLTGSPDESRQETTSSDRDPVPANPDASDATTKPLSTTEPQLAIDPSQIGDTLISPPPATQAATSTPDIVDTPNPATEPTQPEPAATSEPPTTSEPAAEPTPTRAEPTSDPRERPRLAARPTSGSTASQPVEPASEPTQPEPAAIVAARLTEGNPTTGTTQVTQARPSVADPGNSLGLPPVTLPPTYLRQNLPGGARGSQQGEQPQPVLASPQAQPTPQTARGHSSVAKADSTMTRTWRVPSVRRLVRRIGGLGEFANPPTAKPH